MRRRHTGCQWNQIPEVYGDDSTIHRAFQRWVKIGLFEVIWSLLPAECDQLGMVDWQWQAADGSMGKARNGADQIGLKETIEEIVVKRPRLIEKETQHCQRRNNHNTKTRQTKSTER